MGERELDRAEAWGDGWRAGWEAAWAQFEAESAVQVGSVSVSAGQAREVDAGRKRGVWYAESESVQWVPPDVARAPAAPPVSGERLDDSGQAAKAVREEYRKVIGLAADKYRGAFLADVILDAIADKRWQR